MMNTMNETAGTTTPAATHGTSSASEPSRPPPHWDRILIACQKNDPEEVHRLISQDGVSASHGNTIGQTALHVAALWGHIDCIQILLKSGANVHAQNTITGASPLHCCVQSSKAIKPININGSTETTGQLECVKLLLDHGADPSLGDFFGRIPLDYCDEVMETTNGQTASFVKKLRERLQPTVSEIFQLLDALDGRTEGALQSMQNMLETSASVSVLQERHMGVTPLLRVVLDICNDDSHETCDDGNDDNMTNMREQPPNWLLLMKQRVEILKMFIKAGADPFVVPTISRDDHWLPPSEEDAYFHLSQAMVEAHRDADNKKNKHKEKSSLDGSSDVDFQKSRIECLTRAIVTLLSHIGAGDAKTEIIRRSLETMLFEAARRNFVPLARFVLEDCASYISVDLNVAGRQGMTPLQFSARSGRIEMVQYLLSRPTIDPSIQDDRGQTPMDAARVNQHHEVEKMLQSFQSS